MRNPNPNPNPTPNLKHSFVAAPSARRTSKLRPFLGTRATFMPGPRITFEPLSKNSLPIFEPHAVAMSTSNVAARVRPDGKAVVVPGLASSRKP